MNGNCTCGVELVEGARFCHKCGRPVDGFEPLGTEAEEVPAVPVVVVSLPPLTAPPPPLPAPSIGFRNRDTIQAALLAAAITFLPASAIASLSGLLFFGGLLVNGLLGVLLYLRRSGRGMSTIEGARQGWISGLFFFGITSLLMMLTMAFSDKGIGDLMREAAKAQGTLTPDVAKTLDQPAFLAGVIVVAMVTVFVLFTSLASLGGMLGARLFGANANPTEQTGSKLS